MTNAFFHPRLYGQALRRLRILGIALVALVLIFSIVMPVSRWIQEYRDHKDIWRDQLSLGSTLISPEELGQGTDAVKYSSPMVPDLLSALDLVEPILVFSYLSPLLILLAFSFLNHRHESDFYHAIPHRRTCVYLSHLAAALTWMLGALLGGAIVNGVIHGLDPYVTYELSAYIAHVALICLSSLFLASLTTVAVTLSGTLATSLIALGVLAGGWRFVLAMAQECVSDMMDFYVLPSSSYLNIDFLIPYMLWEGPEHFTAAQIVYTALVTLAMFILGGVLYAKRKSELAGRIVPGPCLQGIMRVLVALPTALYLTVLLLCGNSQIGEVMGLAAVTLLVYYLYELLTSKSLRSTLRATPGLCILLLLCLLFSGAMHTTESIINHQDLSAPKLETVGFSAGSYVRGELSGKNGENYVLGQYTADRLAAQGSDDPEVVALMAQVLSRSQQLAIADAYRTGPQDMRLYVDLDLKNGRQISRRICINEKDYHRLILAMVEAEGIPSLPSAGEIKSMTIVSARYSNFQWMDPLVIAQVFEALAEDYAALSSQEQATVQGVYKRPVNDEETETYRINITLQGNYRYYSYEITENCHKTLDLLRSLFEGK